jgi:hypothetical protein
MNFSAKNETSIQFFKTNLKIQQLTPHRLKSSIRTQASSPGLAKNASTSPIQETHNPGKDESQISEAHNRLFIKLCKSKKLDDASFNIFLLRSPKLEIKKSFKVQERLYQHVYKEDKNIQEAIDYYKNKLISKSPILITDSNVTENSIRINKRRNFRKFNKLHLAKRVINHDTPNFTKARVCQRTPSIEVKFLRKELIPQTKARINCQKVRCSSVNFNDTFRNFKLSRDEFSDIRHELIN